MRYEQKKRNRLAGYDYSQDGYYFITVVTKDRIELLSNLNVDHIELTPRGTICSEIINNIPEFYNGVNIDESVIMPNHIHIILTINRAGNVKPGNEFLNENPDRYGLLSKIVKAFKHECKKQCKQRYIDPIEWQKSFYDHVIRNEKAYLRLKEYVINNPIKWHLDAENLKVNGDSTKYYEELYNDKPYKTSPGA
jgi:REP element-mobilizing transposase RayT